jgi:hypothetical protein
MNPIYISDSEKVALKAVDDQALTVLIDRAVHSEHPTGLYVLQLGNCGEYIAQQLRRFERALADFAKAKTAPKRAERRAQTLCAAANVRRAIHERRHRMDMEEREAQLFRIDHDIIPPFRLNKEIVVRVDYQWRRTVDDDWSHNRIAFSHDVNVTPDYSLSASKWRPSAANFEQRRQEELFSHWERLAKSARSSVHQYFKEGGDGAAIPDTYQVTCDAHSGSLNNFSSNFWKECS